MSYGILIDVLRAHAQTYPELFADRIDVDALLEADVYVIDEVAEAVISKLNEWVWPTSFSGMVPPFDTVWFEWKEPMMTLMGHFTGMPEDIDARAGVLIHSIKVKQANAELWQSFIEQTNLADKTMPEAFERAKWHLIMKPFLTNMTSALRIPVMRGEIRIDCYLDANGDPLIEPLVSSLYEQPMYMNGSKFSEAEIAGALENFYSLASSCMLIVCTALTLLNCKNIGTEAHEPAYTRAMRRRNEPPHITYKLLTIRPMRGRARRLPSGNTTGRLMPWHIVPRRQRDYTKGNGLFGRLHGIWWWEPHMRGTPRAGTIIKDYEVKLDS